MPPLYPFYGARLSPGFPDPRRENDMSIVFLQGGGLSKDQLDRVPLNQMREFPTFARWVATLFAKPRGKD
jgi:hypothetical protein